MGAKREYYFGRLIASFFIASAIFGAIFLFSYGISYFNYTHVRSQNTFIESNLALLERTLSNLSCSDEDLPASSFRLDEVGRYIALLENRLDKSDARVIHEKKLYNQMQLKHFTIIRELNQRCDSRFEPILFFYSNDDGIIEQSQQMGELVYAFKKRDSDRIMVYSFDVSLNDSLVANLADTYSVQNVPSVVLNEREQFAPYNLDQLIPYLTR